MFVMVVLVYFSRSFIFMLDMETVMFAVLGLLQFAATMTYLALAAEGCHKVKFGQLSALMGKQIQVMSTLQL